MGQPAARVGDMHICPMVTGVVPHVGGPVVIGIPNVIIGGMPAATLGKMCMCVGPPDSIAKGSTGVFIGGMPAARMGDMTVHGGSIVIGCPTVLIGEVETVLLTIPNIKIILETINKVGGTENCGFIIDSALTLFKGDATIEAPNGRDGSWADIDKRHGTNLDTSLKNKPTSFKDIFADLKARGPGSTNLVGIEYSGGDAHVLVAANINGNVGLMEGQGGGEFITDPAVADSNYNGDGKSNIATSKVP